MPAQPPSLIHIHGAGVQPPEAEWLRVHDEVLFGGRSHDPTDLAYYADLLTPSGDLSTEAADAEPTSAHHLLHPSVVAAGRQHAAHAFLLRLAAAMGPTDHRSRFAVAGRVMPPALRTFYREVSGYLHGEAALAEGMRDRVRAALRRHAGPSVVLAHSLGSVVAFDVLGEPEFADRGITLLTLGSPLGLGPAQDHLQTWRGSRPIELPVSVARWRNFHALGDPVAHGSFQEGLREDFTPSSRIHATEVRNDAEWHHALPGYLAAPEVRDAVYVALEALPD
ncbi:MAG TPA: hypothetical protein VMH24_09150 [Candidatus Sulfotelmatobacter sp.]|nr:hypothetical protein [Candidatus Sulfotelmatobacter sp.]